MTDSKRKAKAETSNNAASKSTEIDGATLQSSIDGSATAMMMVDRDLIVTFANPATVDMVKANLEHFETAFKGFDLDGLIGTCIDTFHKNPAHQRKLLGDPNNLPYKAEIEVG
ncbi:MAG: methyl-accepting chemotaxis protein, partial [Gammaproteobacteria bacterium]